MSMFGVVVPGRPCLAPAPATAGQPSFTGVPGSQWVCDLERPGEISDVLCFLTAPLPCNDEGAGIYYSIPPFTNWEFIGAITNVKPSALLSTGWAFLPQTSQLPLVKLGMYSTVRWLPRSDKQLLTPGSEKLCCADGEYRMLENAPALQEKLLTTPLPDVKKEYARRVALNLYRYLESFQGGAAMPLLDQWFQRFEARYQRDPNFVMKSE